MKLAALFISLCNRQRLQLLLLNLTEEEAILVDMMTDTVMCKNK